VRTACCYLLLLAGLALAPTATAATKDDQRVWATGSLRERPRILVVPGVYYARSNPTSLADTAFSLDLQWTADGAPMSPQLPFPQADCSYGSAQQYNCDALKFFRQNRRGLVNSPDPQAFVIKDLEYDTEYCFRFRKNEGDWTQWSCDRTPPPPAAPPAPPRPQLTAIAAVSGRGTVGDGHGFQLLAEWAPSASEADVAGYQVELITPSSGGYGVVPSANAAGSAMGMRPGAGPYEQLIALPADADPDGRYVVRVCALNIAHRACSPGASIDGRAYAQAKRPHAGLPTSTGGATSEATDARGDARAPEVAFARVRTQGAPPPICDAARSARARNSPAAPGLERQCLANGGSLGAPAPAGPTVDDLAAIGARIAAQDDAVAQARGADPSAFFGVGFDVGSGLFGDPALGAKGNTLMGPGSQRIRDSLSPAGQRGFDAAVAFHQARDYRR